MRAFLPAKRPWGPDPLAPFMMVFPRYQSIEGPKPTYVEERQTWYSVEDNPVPKVSEGGNGPLA